MISFRGGSSAERGSRRGCFTSPLNTFAGAKLVCTEPVISLATPERSCITYDLIYRQRLAIPRRQVWQFARSTGFPQELRDLIFAGIHEACTDLVEDGSSSLLSLSNKRLVQIMMLEGTTTVMSHASSTSPIHQDSYQASSDRRRVPTAGLLRYPFSTRLEP